MKIVKIGTVELTEEEAYKMYEEGKYIVTYSKIYQLFYSAAQKRVYGQQIYSQKGLARRGRFYSMDGETVNHILGFNLVVA